MTKLQWFKVVGKEGKTLVFDPLRKAYVTLTPEEEVRQKMLYLLVEHLKVPAGLIAVEYSVKVNGLDKRCDAVVFGQNGSPLMIVECKAASIALTQLVLDQAIRYYAALHPLYLMLYNGIQCYCFKAKDGSLMAVDHLPTFEEMR